MNVLSLFSGIGGLELDPYCRAVLAKHWPDVPRHDDVRTARAWWASQDRPPVHVVAGGYPCQPESTAGLRKGTEDERWLWSEMARVIYTLKPRWVVGENVIGHRTKGLRFVLRDLERLGYTARAGTVLTSEMGAPHERARLFVLAFRRTDADTESSGQGQHRRPELSTERQSTAQPEIPTYRASQGRRPWWLDASRGSPPGGEHENGAVSTGNAWWADEPPVARMVYGVPGRVDRARILGNAVVPFCSEHIGRIVMHADRELGLSDAAIR